MTKVAAIKESINSSYSIEYLLAQSCCLINLNDVDSVDIYTKLINLHTVPKIDACQ